MSISLALMAVSSFNGESRNRRLTRLSVFRYAYAKTKNHQQSMQVAEPF
jgi:hypothetical protein